MAETTDPVGAMVAAIRGLRGVYFADQDEHLPEVMGDFLVLVDFDRSDDGWAALAAVVRACREAGDNTDVIAMWDDGGEDEGTLNFCLRGMRGADAERIADAISAAR